MNVYAQRLAAQLGLGAAQVDAALGLIDEGNTSRSSRATARRPPARWTTARCARWTSATPT